MAITRKSHMNFTRAEKRDLLLGCAFPERQDKKLFKKYFRTDHWKMTRARKLNIHPICELCRFRKATQVHHARYSTLFNEDIDRDLTAVCARCHRKIS